MQQSCETNMGSFRKILTSGRFPVALHTKSEVFFLATPQMPRVAQNESAGATRRFPYLGGSQPSGSLA